MLGERTRNVIVGLTIILSLVVCVYGINLLGKIPRNALHQYQITLIAPDANGIGNDARVLFNGLDVGVVKSVYAAKLPDDQLIVKLELSIASDIQIPESATALLTRPQAVGNPYVDIKAKYAKPPMLSTNGSATLPATASDSGIIPEKVFKDVHDLKTDLSTLTAGLNTVAGDLHVLLRNAPPEAVDAADPKDPNHLTANASTVIRRLDDTIKNLQGWLTDPKLQNNVRSALQNIDEATAQLKATLQKIDTAATNANTAITGFGTAATSINTTAAKATETLETVQKEVTRVSQTLVEALAQIDKSVKQLTEGNGTSGKLINDPRLYENLNDLSLSLKATVGDLDFLLKKWKDEGVNLKLK